MPERSTPPAELCAVHDAIRVLQGKWTLQIVRALLGGTRGFNELARAVGGCNPATLSKRLEALAELGLVTKRIESTMPPRTHYSLTRAGRALEGVVAAIERWGERYLPKPPARGGTAPPSRRNRPA
ncbi:MAG: helix-turn-helix transcriptional regulator [Thermoanaerobaculia bacterium]|nr:MAG: helix-turn-helix transcriptional regulator [Thermoanaerobaculia bacterium]